MLKSKSIPAFPNNIYRENWEPESHENNYWKLLGYECPQAFFSEWLCVKSRNSFHGPYVSTLHNFPEEDRKQQTFFLPPQIEYAKTRKEAERYRRRHYANDVYGKKYVYGLLEAGDQMGTR